MSGSALVEASGHRLSGAFSGELGLYDTDRLLAPATPIAACDSGKHQFVLSR
jgi:hypothetical protein